MDDGIGPVAYVSRTGRLYNIRIEKNGDVIVKSGLPEDRLVAHIATHQPECVIYDKIPENIRKKLGKKLAKKSRKIIEKERDRYLLLEPIKSYSALLSNDGLRRSERKAYIEKVRDIFINYDMLKCPKVLDIFCYFIKFTDLTKKEYDQMMEIPFRWKEKYSEGQK